MYWHRETLWYLAVGLAVAVVVSPSWPVALVLVAVVSAASFSDRLAHDTRRREVLGEEILSRLDALESTAGGHEKQLDQVTTRLVTVENRTRPMGR